MIHNKLQITYEYYYRHIVEESKTYNLSMFETIHNCVGLYFSDIESKFEDSLSGFINSRLRKGDSLYIDDINKKASVSDDFRLDKMKKLISDICVGKYIDTGKYIFYFDLFDKKISFIKKN